MLLLPQAAGLFMNVSLEAHKSYSLINLFITKKPLVFVLICEVSISIKQQELPSAFFEHYLVHVTFLNYG